MTSLRGYIVSELGVVASGCLAAKCGPMIGLEQLHAGLIGAGIVFAIKPILTPTATQNFNHLVYVSSVRNSFG